MKNRIPRSLSERRLESLWYVKHSISLESNSKWDYYNKSREKAEKNWKWHEISNMCLESCVNFYYFLKMNTTKHDKALLPWRPKQEYTFSNSAFLEYNNCMEFCTTTVLGKKWWGWVHVLNGHFIYYLKRGIFFS